MIDNDANHIDGLDRLVPCPLKISENTLIVWGPLNKLTEPAPIIDLLVQHGLELLSRSNAIHSTLVPKIDVNRVWHLKLYRLQLLSYNRTLCQICAVYAHYKQDQHADYGN